MRGELDDALARMARREEIKRRVAEQSADGESPADEVTEAVRRVVAQHQGLAVRLWVEDGTAGTGVRVAWRDGAVAVTPEANLDPPPAGGPEAVSWPVSGRNVPGWPAADGVADASAARLAEMIRRDPSLLDTTDRGA
jgi:hypothetical protein